MRTRRDFLRTSSLIALAPSVPGFLAATARAAGVKRDGRVLVVVELEGGNDGINTVVPLADEGYALHRKRLRLAKDGLVKVTDSVGLHPSLAGFGELLQKGRLAIVAGVGYPNPSRSHFRSMAVWQTARLDPEDHKGLGWLGRALDGRGAGPDPSAQVIGTGPPPVATRGRGAVATALETIDDFRLPAGAGPPGKSLPAAEPADDLTAFVHRSMLDAYATSDRLEAAARAKEPEARYPGSALAGRMRLLARLLKAGLFTPVFYVRHAGFDTHAAQLDTHADLLSALNGAVKAFLEDLQAAGLADRVVVLIFSEFGRTVKENASAGTDHGTSGPVFLAGANLAAGVKGKVPSLTDLDPVHGDLRTSVDFRRVYAAVLEDWLGLPAKAALGGSFERLPLFRG